MPFPDMPPEMVSHFDVLSAVGGAPPEDDVAPEPSRARPKAGLWDWLTGAAAPPGRPHFPTLVRIAAMTPAPVTNPGSAGASQGPFYQVTIEVETEPWQVDKSIAPRPAATHYVLTTSVVKAAREQEDESDAEEEFRHHCKSTVPFARCATFAVTGLIPGTLYEFDVCASNAMGSSEGVQVHVLTPSPTSGSTASPHSAAAAALEATATRPVPEGDEDEEEEEEEEGEDCFFDADEHEADAESRAPVEDRGALEEDACCKEEAEVFFEECIDAADQAGPSRPTTPQHRAKSVERRHSQHGTADAAGGPQAPLFPGFVWASGFQVNERQLTLGNVEPRDIDQAVERIMSQCVCPISIKPQQALRLALGMGTDISTSESKWRQILSWRREFRMEEERARARELHRNRSIPVSFPYHDEVCKKLLMVSPAVLVTTNGYPVSVWHISTLNLEAATTVPVEHVNAWSRSLFEYLDVWLAEESDRTSRLLGHIHVFDLEGLSWWHLVSGELLERGRAALHAGEFYVENCYDVYAINASTLFNTVWRLLQRFLSARAAAKIVVDSGVPNELLTALGPMAWERLQGVLQAPKSKAQQPILRPPRRGGRAALL